MTMSSAFDPDASKRMTVDSWQQGAADRRLWGAALQAWLGPLTGVMRALTRCSPSERVLDLAPNMFADAERDVQERAPTKLQIQIVEEEHLTLADNTLDVVLSRAGLFSVTDSAHVLAAARRVLRPGGRVAVAVYGAPERNAFLSIPLGSFRGATQLSPLASGQPGPFHLAGPGALAGALREAGFTGIDVRVVHAPLRLPSAAECARFVREALVAFHPPLPNLPTDEREAAWGEIAQALCQFESSRVFVAPCELLVGVGTK